MAHYYGGIQGQAGEATRMGPRSSGISGYVQGWQSRLSVDMDHHSALDIDNGHFRLHNGPSGNGGSLSLTFRDIDAVTEALGSGDKRIDAIRERIYKEVQKLNEEAPKAIKRTKRRRKIEANRREREAKRAEQQRRDIIRDMRLEEKARLVQLVNCIELDSEGNFEDIRTLDAINPRLNEIGHIVITVRQLDWLWDVNFDLTAGLWLLPHSPDELEISSTAMHGFGWRIDNEKVTA